MRSRLLAVLAIPAACGAALVAVPAWAALTPDASIDHVSADQSGKVEMLFSVTSLPPGVTPDVNSLTVTVDGREVRSSAQKVPVGSIERTTVLALDTSLSMERNGKFEAAKSAAQSFIALAPPDVRIGLVTFDGSVRLEAGPTTNHPVLTRKIESLQLSLGTRLYDGIAEGARVAGTEGARSVLVLSDGADMSGTPIETAITAADKTGVKVDVVALQQSPANRTQLQLIADATGGAVIRADDPAGLKQLFRAEAEALAQQILVRFDRPDGTDSEASLTASVEAAGVRYEASAFVNLSGGEADPADGPKAVRAGEPLVDQFGLMLGAIGLGVGLAGVLAIVLIGRRPDKLTTTQQQMSMYTVAALADADHTMQPTPAGGAGRGGVRQSAIAVAETVVKGTEFDVSLGRRLSAAGIALTPAEWLLIHVGIAVLSAFVGFALGGAVPMLLFLAAGGLVPWLYLGHERNKRVEAFNGQLADTLQLVAGGLSSGLSLLQALDTAVREGSTPTADELRRALIEQRLGVDIEDALDGVAERMTSEDFRWVVMAIRIQREVGGNLAELLNTVAATLRERDYLRRQVRVLSAEGRVSAWVLGCLPLAMVLYLSFARPGYLRALYAEPMGIVMSVSAVMLLAFGVWWLSRLVRMEV
jgi:tight adherence protein B